MSNENPSFNLERKIAHTKESLPSLKEGHIRLVHLTRAEAAESILKTGLSYRGHGMLQSTARGWGDEKMVEFSSKDPRFSGEGMVAVVLDMPFDEHRKHERIGQAPGVVPPEYVVGIIPSEN
jgi:hypothetical protein